MTVDASNVSSVEIKTAHVVLTGDNNRVIQKVNLILKQRYLGDNTKLRRAIEHDLEMLEQYPEGAVRSELVAHIEENTNKLIARGRMTPHQVWMRRGVKIGITLVIVVVLAGFSVAVTTRHSRIQHGHPELPWAGKWVLAAEALFGDVDLSPRGNVMPKLNQVIDVRGENPSGEDVTFFTFKLVDEYPISACAPNAPDPVPHPKNGHFVRLDFEIAGGGHDLQSGGDSFAKKQFYAETLDEQKSDIGETAGAECVPDAKSDGIRNIPAGSKQHLVMLADVPSGHGYIVFNFDPRSRDYIWEWSY